MKILLASVGTRGDMEPFLAIGELLQKEGHEVVCLFPEQFRALADDSGFRFLSLGPEFIELLESDTGKAAMGGSATTIEKIKAYTKLAKIFAPLRRKLVDRQYVAFRQECPDRVVQHAKAIYAFVWGLENAGKNILVNPVPLVMHPVENQAHIMFNRNLGSLLNKATYALARFGLVKALVNDTKKLGLPYRLNSKTAKQALDNARTIYALSPTLFSRPNYWPEHVQVLGYHERNKKMNWEPNDSLLQFLQKHDRFLLVTFGSMTNPDPERKTQILIEQLQLLKIPAIINTAGGGLVKLENDCGDLIHFVDRVPYDYIFPKTYGVVHHGGSGTSHMAIKYGCASLIIPHIIDQFFWNKLLAEKGVGPKGPPITKLKAKKIAPLLYELWTNRTYKQNSEQLAYQMAKEDFSEQLVEFIVGK